MGGIHRQRRGNRLSGGTLPGFRLLQLRPDRHYHDNFLHRHGPFSEHHVQLLRERYGHCGQREPLSQFPRHGHDAQFDGAGRSGYSNGQPWRLRPNCGRRPKPARFLDNTVHTSAPFNSTGGNLILLYAYTLPGVTFTPSDTLNNTWIPIAGPTTTTSGGNLLTELWYAWNPKVGPGHTITITLSPTGEPLLMSILVLQNADTSSPIDAVSLIGSNSGSATVISPSLTTTGVNDLLTGFAATSANVTFTPENGFTLQAGASDVVLAAETAPAATPGVYTAAFVLSPSEAWQSAVVAALSNPNQVTVSWSPASGNILNYLVWRCATACMFELRAGWHRPSYVDHLR